MVRLTVTENENGLRLDKLVRKYLPLAPSGFIYKMIRKKNIVLNGRRCSGSDPLTLGDVVTLYLSDETISKWQNQSQALTASSGGWQESFDIIAEDEHLLAMNKHVGVLSQKSRTEDISLVDDMLQYLRETHVVSEESLLTFRPGIANRLDRNTSGIILAGKTLACARELAKLIREHKLRKYYHCLVLGSLSDSRHLSGLLKKDRSRNVAAIEDEEGVPVELTYRSLIHTEKMSLLEVELITGRSHQIRAQMAHIGHPIIGDPKYGDPAANRYYKERFGLTAQLLHAQRIEFPSSIGGVLAPHAGETLTAEKPDLFFTVEALINNQERR